MAFDEVRFPITISYGSRGGPRFLTDVVRGENGHESRVGIWDDSSGTYNARWGVKTMAQLLEVITFFYARNAKLRGFRFRDWLDYIATQEPLVVTGANTVQLIRNYTSGAITHRRMIRKPVAGTVTMRRGGSPFAAFTLDTTTGIATLTPDSSANIANSSAFTITGITQNNPAVVTISAPADFIDGDTGRIASVVGMTEVNGLDFVLNQTSTTTFELVGINSTGFGAYVSGGTLTHIGMSKQNPIRVRSVAHGFTGTPIIYLKSIVGMTQANGLYAAITVIDADRFTIAIDGTGFTAYVSGGVAEEHVQPSEDLDWSGEFDVAVRFDMDSIQASIEAFDIGDIPDLPLVELFND